MAEQSPLFQRALSALIAMEAETQHLQGRLDELRQRDRSMDDLLTDITTAAQDLRREQVMVVILKLRALANTMEHEHAGKTGS